MKNLLNWNFKSGNVQSVTNSTDFLSSESVILCAGTPRYDDMENPQAELIPVGLIQNATVSQNKQIQQLFEIGSREPVFIPGRTVVQVAVSRILFDGESLMRALYSNANPDFADSVFKGEGDDRAPGLPYTTAGNSSKFFINLAAEFFNRPMGLAFILEDMDNDEAGTSRYGGFYLENCRIQSHQFSVASQQTILLENIGLRTSKLIPIHVSDQISPDKVQTEV